MSSASVQIRKLTLTLALAVLGLLLVTGPSTASPDATTSIINGSRRQRLARGSGRSIEEVNKLMKQFEETRKVMKMMGDKTKMQNMMRQMQAMQGMRR